MQIFEVSVTDCKMICPNKTDVCPFSSFVFGPKAVSSECLTPKGNNALSLLLPGKLKPFLLLFHPNPMCLFTSIFISLSTNTYNKIIIKQLALSKYISKIVGLKSRVT